MPKHQTVDVKDTYEIAKNQILNKDYSFFMRNLEQAEYHPDKVHFIDKRYRRAYIIQDMAGLVTSNEISNFLSDFAYKLREQQYEKIKSEEIKLIGKFINDSKEEYDNITYKDLTDYVSAQR